MLYNIVAFSLQIQITAAKLTDLQTLDCKQSENVHFVKHSSHPNTLKVIVSHLKYFYVLRIVRIFRNSSFSRKNYKVHFEIRVM